MRVNLDFLKKYIDIDYDKSELKELLASIGLEVNEIIEINGATVFEVEITPNRPDWLSHIGIAREIHAKVPELGYRLPVFKERAVSAGQDLFSIEIEHPEDCGRYTGCIVRDIEVTESTDEMKALLESFGLRPINNIVDISNFVLMAIGHPLHIFDLDTLKGNTIKIRRANGGETLKLLTEEVLELNENHLVIADQDQPVALAGVMGGKDSGVTFSSRNIFIESAHFDPIVVRKCAKSFGLKTDASFRFERGADILMTQNAMAMALDMLGKSMGKEFQITYLHDNFPVEFQQKKVTLKKDFPSTYTGIEIKEEISVQVLESLGFSVTDDSDQWIVEVPSYRVDIYGKQDLVEEIIRIYGYDKLDSKIPATTNTDFKADDKRDFIAKAGNYMVSVGFHEAINYIFHGSQDNALFSGDSGAESFVEIKNPLGKDYSVLRNSLLAGLLRNTALNFNQGMTRVSLFEFGRVFIEKDKNINEFDKLSIVASGEYQPANWIEKKQRLFDFYIFKSLLAAIFDNFFLSAKLKKQTVAALHNDCSFVVEVGGIDVGYAGLLSPNIQESYKIDTDVYVAEIDIKTLLEKLEEKAFVMWAKFPASKRDFSFLMDRNISYDKIDAVIEELSPCFLEDYNLSDLYDGENIPSGKISLSMSFSYRDPDRTLTNDEINETHNQFIQALVARLNLIQR